MWSKHKGGSNHFCNPELEGHIVADGHSNANRLWRNVCSFRGVVPFHERITRWTKSESR